MTSAISARPRAAWTPKTTMPTSKNNLNRPSAYPFNFVPYSVDYSAIRPYYYEYTGISPKFKEIEFGEWGLDYDYDLVDDELVFKEIDIYNQTGSVKKLVTWLELQKKKEECSQ